MKPVIEPENASNKKLLYTSSDESIATVDEAGLVTPHKAGIVRITIQSEDGYASRTCYITVAATQDETPTFTLGDVDHDGNITTDDALAVLKYAVGIQSAFDISLSDCDNDGKITTDDALIILKHAVGLIQLP